MQIYYIYKNIEIGHGFNWGLGFVRYKDKYPGVYDKSF